MEHETHTDSEAPSQPDAPNADLDAYGDWVTVDAVAAPRPAAPELTEAEEELLGRLSETDRAVPDDAPPPTVTFPTTGGFATTAALAELEDRISTLSDDLTAVKQQIDELRNRAPQPDQAEPAAPPSAGPWDLNAELDTESDDSLAITLEEVATDVVTTPHASDLAAPDAEPNADGGAESASDPPSPGTVDRIELHLVDTDAAPDTVRDVAATDAVTGAAEDSDDTQIRAPLREEVRSVLAYLDQLLDALPPDKIQEFAQSTHFATYKRLFKELALDD